LERLVLTSSTATTLTGEGRLREQNGDGPEASDVFNLQPSPYGAAPDGVAAVLGDGLVPEGLDLTHAPSTHQAKVVCVSKMATVLKLSINHQTSAEPSFRRSQK